MQKDIAQASPASSWRVRARPAPERLEEIDDAEDVSQRVRRCPGPQCGHDDQRKIDDELRMLREVKAIGLELKDQHVKQAVDYAANQGPEWVVLTSSQLWRIYKVVFGKPITSELLLELDPTALNHQREEAIALLSLLTKDSWQKAKLGDYYSRRQALGRLTLGVLVTSDEVLAVVRREIRRATPDLTVELEEIKSVLPNDVLKHEVLAGESALAARKAVPKASSRALRASGPGEGKEAAPPVD
jgi:hypothetical protein